MSAPQRHLALRTEAGFGMIELLCALAVMSAGILAIFAMLESGAVQIRRAAAVTTAAAIADSEMETFRAIKYERIGLDDAAVATADSRYSGDSAYRTDSPTTTITTAMTSASTAVIVGSAAGFPSTAPFRVKIDNEIMLVTAGAGTTSWTVQRGVDNTTAASHAGGATLSFKQRVHLPPCGTSPCTTYVPTKSVTGADGKSYRLDIYVTWSTVSNSTGTSGRNVKVVTAVVRDALVPSKTYARVSSSFDESTGL